MKPEELNKCLQKFYVAARKKDGNYYNRKSLTAIRAAIDRHLRSPPLSKPFSIVADTQFKEANKTLSNVLKNLSKNGEISGTKHKGAVTREVVQKLYEKNKLVGANKAQAGTRKPGKDEEEFLGFETRCERGEVF